MPTDSTTSSTSKVLLGCTKCGASLPSEAQFCLKCGKPVSSPPKKVKVVEAQLPALPRETPKGRLFLWMLLVVLIGLVCWSLTSDSVGAQGLQELVGFKQDGIILDSSLTVGPHTFRYYKFALPEGSVNVTVVGQFKSTADSATPGTRKNQTTVSSNDKNRSGVQSKDDNNVDNNIEVYVLTDSAFAVWQNGYATSSLYESGKIAEGALQTDIPAGAGVYYLVFSNKSAPKTPKALHATVLLHYKSWLPDWVRRVKGRFLDWVGV